MSLRSIGCAGICLAFLLNVAEPASGPSPIPNFAGTWVLNAAQSRFAPLPPIIQREDRIEQTPSLITIHRSESTEKAHRTNEVLIHLDGAQTTWKSQTTQAHWTAHWDGKSLIVDSSIDFEGMPLQVRDQWLLSADGKTLEILRHFENHLGSIEQKIVLQKQ